MIVYVQILFVKLIILQYTCWYFFETVSIHKTHIGFCWWLVVGEPVLTVVEFFQFLPWWNCKSSYSPKVTSIRGLMRSMATLPQGNQELLVVTDKVGRPKWAWSKEVHGMWCFSLQCFDSVGWATGRASGL